MAFDVRAFLAEFEKALARLGLHLHDIPALAASGDPMLLLERVRAMQPGVVRRGPYSNPESGLADRGCVCGASARDHRG
jgi:hypothetical protein